MPAWTINLLEALQEIAEVENCLIDGRPPVILHGNNTLKTATRMAAEKMNLDPQSLRGRIGTPETPGRVWRRWRYDKEQERKTGDPYGENPPRRKLP